jgi:hypothetical protein
MWYVGACRYGGVLHTIMTFVGLWPQGQIIVSFEIGQDKKCYGPNKKILFKKQLFVLEVKGQDPTKVIMVCNTSPYGHAPTYQISLTLFYCNIEMCHIPANINLR